MSCTKSKPKTHFFFIIGQKKGRKKHENSLTIKVFYPGDGTKPAPCGSSQNPWWVTEWTTLRVTISQRLWLCSQGSFLWWWAIKAASISARYSILQSLWGSLVYTGIVFPCVLIAFTIIQIICHSYAHHLSYKQLWGKCFQQKHTCLRFSFYLHALACKNFFCKQLDI